MVDEDVNFRVIKRDADAAEIKDYFLKRKKNHVVSIFVDHNVDEINGLVDVPNCVTTAQVGESSQVLNTDKEKEVLLSGRGGKYLNFIVQVAVKTRLIILTLMIVKMSLRN